jgi:dienelactone hydrolase
MMTKRQTPSETRQLLFQLLGDIPARPHHTKPLSAKTSEHDHYIRETFFIDNAYGDQIPTQLLLPRKGQPPYPAILYLHAHGHRYETGNMELYHKWDGKFSAASELTQAGYAVISIDAYAFGQRQSHDEMTLFKRFLWEGKTLWGMMLRDDLISLDYLSKHPEIDAERIGVLGMSMGSTRAWWLAALDERIKATVAVACLTRYQDLVEAEGLSHHSIYFFVPSILKHLDTEDILTLIAPRPLLCLTGDQDPTSPVAGIRKIEQRLKEVYRKHGMSDNFINHIYPSVGHTFSSAMWKNTLVWLPEHL